MKKYIFILSVFFFSCTNNFKLQEGDLLFQDLDSSPICDAIELVTPGYHGSNFSHIGLIVFENDMLPFDFDVNFLTFKLWKALSNSLFSFINLVSKL